jgi:hypothetical protein
MEPKILKYKRIYKIFTALALVGFIDLIIIPILFKELPLTIPTSVGLIPLLLYKLIGGVGVTIGVWVTTLWFIWGVIALAFKQAIKKLENNK